MEPCEKRKIRGLSRQSNNKTMKLVYELETTGILENGIEGTTQLEILQLVSLINSWNREIKSHDDENFELNEYMSKRYRDCIYQLHENLENMTEEQFKRYLLSEVLVDVQVICERPNGCKSLSQNYKYIKGKSHIWIYLIELNTMAMIITIE